MDIAREKESGGKGGSLSPAGLGNVLLTHSAFETRGGESLRGISLLFLYQCCTPNASNDKYLTKNINHKQYISTHIKQIKLCKANR